jgi:microsomal epoxide hydrolase
MRIEDSASDTTFDIHFVALFSKRADATPILLIHGWPGSFLEFLSIFSHVKSQYAPETVSFYLIVPSLPGYAFSSALPLDRDFRIEDVARVMNQLMLELSFGNGYVVQGGDIGSKIARVIAAEHEACNAIHRRSLLMIRNLSLAFLPVNICIMPKPQSANPSTYTIPEKIGLERG